MDIQQLTLVITDADLTKLASEHIQKRKHPVDNVKVAIKPEGVTVTGEVSLFMPVKFETLWELSVADGKPQVRLVKVKAFGMGGSLFKSALEKIVEEAVKKEPGLEYQDGTILVDIPTLAAQEGLDVQIHVQTIRCDAGSLTVVAMPPPK